jgi:hypothetical protein
MRLLMNVMLKGVLVYLASVLGWLTVHPLANVGSPWNTIWVMAGVALIFMVVQFIMWLLYFLLVKVSGGLAIVALPIMALLGGYFVLELTATWWPGLLTLSSSFWLVALTGLVLAMVGVPKSKNNQTSGVRVRVRR